MENDLKKLNELTSTLKRLSSKVKLLTLINTAKSEYDSYDFASCKNTLVKAYEMEPLNPIVLRGLGCLEQFDKNYDKAIDFYKQALKLSENKEIEYTLIGMAYYIQDKLDDAIKYFNLAIDENEDYEQAYEGRNQAMLESHVDILELQQALKKYF